MRQANLNNKEVSGDTFNAVSKSENDLSMKEGIKPLC